MPVYGTTESVSLPTGEYPVECKKIEPEDGKYGKQLKFSLEVFGTDDDDYDGKLLFYWASVPEGKDKDVTTKSKLWRAAIAFGMDLEAGDRIDTDELIGCRCVAVVLERPKEGTQETISKVEDLKRPKAKKDKETKSKKSIFQEE